MSMWFDDVDKGNSNFWTGAFSSFDLAGNRLNDSFGARYNEFGKSSFNTYYDNPWESSNYRPYDLNSFKPFQSELKSFRDLDAWRDSDQRAIKSDWEQVGGDFKKVFDSY